MKMKYKIIIAMILILLTIIILSNITLATTLDEFNTTKVPAGPEFNNIGNATVRVLTTIGMVLSVIVLVVLGIKYMMGSVDERAEYKKTLMPYVIGAILIFSASSIASIIYNIAKDL